MLRYRLCRLAQFLRAIFRKIAVQANDLGVQGTVLGVGGDNGGILVLTEGRPGRGRSFDQADVVRIGDDLAEDAQDLQSRNLLVGQPRAFDSCM